MYSKHCRFVLEGTEDALIPSRKLHHLPPVGQQIIYTPYGGATIVYKVETVTLKIVGVRYAQVPSGAFDVEEYAWFIELSLVP
jgi:hypothetical protein